MEVVGGGVGTVGFGVDSRGGGYTTLLVLLVEGTGMILVMVGGYSVCAWP